MMSSIGDFALGLALLASMATVLAVIAAVRFESDAVLTAARRLVVGFAALMTIASAALLVALIQCDFRIEYVTHYTEVALPVGYKIAAFWAGQEGSILLWAWVLALMSSILVIGRKDLKGGEGAAVVGTLAIVCGFFAAVLLFAANPFKPAAEIHADGHGLNPLLQNPAMVAHPPILFLGYAGFTIPFALLIGALAAGRRDNEWLAGARRWIIASWLLLTAGILLGAQWAYVELGWGGYWAWDPVENASLLPWLTGTALLHSMMAQQHRGLFKKWNASLIVLSFLLCIFGTYLTRSGVIQSVHAFGESAIGTFFLTFLIVAALASVTLMLARRRELSPEQELTTLVGREGAFLATNVLLVGMMAVTLIGTIFPIISRVMGQHEVTVKPDFYNKVVAPMGMLLIGIMAVGPLLTYGETAAKRLVKGSIIPAIIAIATALAFGTKVHSGWALLAAAIVAFGVACVFTDLIRAIRTNHDTGVLRLLDANHRRYGGQLTHLGMLMILVGIVGSSIFNDKQDIEMRPGQTVTVAGQQLTFTGLRQVQGPNYTAMRAELTLTDAGGNVTTIAPERRQYLKTEQPNSEVSITTDWRRDVYVTLAGWEEGGAVTGIQVIVNPLVVWIWIGGIVMAVGGIVCLLPRLLPVSGVSPVVVVATPTMGGKVAVKAS